MLCNWHCPLIILLCQRDRFQGVFPMLDVARRMESLGDLGWEAVQKFH